MTNRAGQNLLGYRYIPLPSVFVTHPVIPLEDYVTLENQLSIIFTSYCSFGVNTYLFTIPKGFVIFYGLLRRLSCHALFLCGASFYRNLILILEVCILL